MASCLKLEGTLLRALGLAKPNSRALNYRCLSVPSLYRPRTRLPILPRLQSRRFSHTRPRPQDWHRQDPEERLRYAKPLVARGGVGRFVRLPSTRIIAVLAFASAVVFYYSNLQTVPVSGRRRFNCYSEGAVEAVSEQQVKRIIYDVENQGGRFLSAWDPRTRMVQRVMKRLIPVSGMEDSNWEVRVIDDPRMMT